MCRHCDLLLADVQDAWSKHSDKPEPQRDFAPFVPFVPMLVSAFPQRLEPSMAFILSSSSFSHLQH